MQTLHQLPTEPAFVQDPYPFYDRARATGALRTSRPGRDSIGRATPTLSSRSGLPVPVQTTTRSAGITGTLAVGQTLTAHAAFGTTGSSVAICSSTLSRPRLPGTACVVDQRCLDWLPPESFRDAADRGSLCCRLFLASHGKQP